MVSVIKNLTVTSYQQSYTGNISQIKDTSIIYESGSDTAINGLFTFLEAICSQSSSFTPPKNNEDVGRLCSNY